MTFDEPVKLPVGLLKGTSASAGGLTRATLRVIETTS